MAMTILIDETLIAKMTEAISVGASYKTAAGCAGISQRIWQKWKKDALSDNPNVPQKKEKLQLIRRLKEAESAREVTWLSVIEQASVKSWQAAAWKLERINFERYGRLAELEFERRLKSLEMRHRGHYQNVSIEEQSTQKVG
jgi:hypothetical protein